MKQTHDDNLVSMWPLQRRRRRRRHQHSSADVCGAFSLTILFLLQAEQANLLKATLMAHAHGLALSP
jgi:hypothetical protein